MNDKNEFTMLDGSAEEEAKSVERFFNTFTKEEIERSMSSEFDYVDKWVKELELEEKGEIKGENL